MIRFAAIYLVISTAPWCAAAHHRNRPKRRACFGGSLQCVSGGNRWTCGDTSARRGMNDD